MIFQKTLLFTCLFFGIFAGYSQVVTECPQNIGFENGTFTNWDCYIGIVGGQQRHPEVATGEVSVDVSGPSYDRHDIIKRGSGVDPYGQFSTDAPNGSDYVVKLGNNVNGAEAERISYTVAIPSKVNDYSIIFNYAVVFENPNHTPDEQPKFTAKVFDISTNSSTSCGSFEFVASGDLPGFQASSAPGSMGAADVLYKSWSPVLVNLSDYIGHTIRLEFTTNDCTRGGHFGYAYIDFNENCSIPITGNITCPDADSLTLRVLPGFAAYRWFNANTNEDLGTQETVTLKPIPLVGTKIGVALAPYGGLGCSQTLYTFIERMDMHIKDPPPRCITFGVDLTDISLKVGNSSDLTYSYYTDLLAKHLVADPRHIRVNGTYYVKGLSSSGCFKIQAVNVYCTELSTIAVTNPEPVNYPNTVDLTKTFVHESGLTYSYWTDHEATIPVKNPTRIRFSGNFFIKGIDSEGCATTAPVSVEVILPDMVIPNTFTPNGDGINDVFTILVNSRIKIKSLQIYNRWGQTVFLTSDITNYWDGLKENTMVPAGVYYWVIEGMDDSQKRFLKSGSITVIR
jgi:gliding motility-associated-like protein